MAFLTGEPLGAQLDLPTCAMHWWSGMQGAKVVP